MKLKLIISLCLLSGIFSNALAVTESEMEQARVITVKNYLRWANNGSGYLDELKETPSNLADLKKVLKTKELENLKAVEKIAVPKDYASWDQAKFVKYWSETFLASPGLDEQGKRSHSRTAKALKDMKLSAPQKEAPASEPAANTPLANAENAQNAETQPEADQIADEIAGQMAAVDTAAAGAEDAALDEITAEDVRPQKSNATWIYVGILIFLVVVVVVLVIYAARSMKGNRENDPDDSDELGSSSQKSQKNDDTPVYAPSDSVDRKEHEFMIERKNEKIRKVKAELDVVREENARLQAAHDALQTRLSQAQTQIESLKIALGEADAKKQPMTRSLFLGRVNRNGLFVRADRQLNPEATVYRLESEDGYTGSFRVVNQPEVTERALDNPMQWLDGGCIAVDIEDTDGFNEIITETSGTAVLENGCWKMVRKAKIKYQ